MVYLELESTLGWNAYAGKGGRGRGVQVGQSASGGQIKKKTFKCPLLYPLKTMKTKEP